MVVPGRTLMVIEPKAKASLSILKLMHHTPFLIASTVLFQKDLRYYPLLNPLYPDTRPLITASDDDHARIRKVFSNAFSAQALKKQEPLLLKHIDLLIEAIGNKRSAKFDAVVMLNFVSFDTVGDLTFGESLGLLEGNEYYAKWVNSLFSELKLASLLRLGLYYPILMKILELLVPKSIQEDRMQHFRNSNARVDRRLAKERSYTDFWTLAEREDKNGNPIINIPEMHQNAATFMVAGTETTATLLSGLIFFLLTNPAKLKILTDEVRGSFLNEDEMTLERLPQLQYLTACLQEALRIYPPAPWGFGRFAPRGGAMVGDYWVPEGVSIC